MMRFLLAALPLLALCALTPEPISAGEPAGEPHLSRFGAGKGPALVEGALVLLDNERIESVEVDYGEGVNPFDVHPLAVIPLELLASDARLLRQAEEVDSYLATGIVEVSRLDVQGLDPLIIQLQPTRATLQAGEGVTFELDLWE